MASQRDLTSNNPHFHISSSRNNTNDDFNSDHNPRNPFGDEPEEEEEELDSASFSSSSQNNQPHHPLLHQIKP